MPICPKCHGENPELGAKCPRDGYYYIYEDAVEDAESDDWIGRLAADKYVILAMISEGGMGAVYRAMQLPVQREVAFKVLRTELQDSDKGRDRFAREARAVSQLTHPNIITMHDFGVDSGGHPFMVMEYAPGNSLAEWMMQPGLTLGRICHVFRQILSALSEAHEQGIIHRDLKPENLIVTRAGNDPDFVKLLDFGIARMVHDGATRGLTREGEVFGTPHYMAPEQAQGKKNIGPPADVYALGIMFYELLGGECPFDAPTPLSILYMHINDQLPELQPRRGLDVPDALRAIITRATAKTPEERFEDAGQMLAALDQALGNASGVYTAPSATGAHSSLVVGEPDAETRLEKATAATLMLDGGQAQRVTGSSNGVPVGDPDFDTAMELEALRGQNNKKLILVLAVLALLIGGGAVLALTVGSGGDSPEPAKAAADSAGEDAPAADKPTDKPATKALSAKKPQDEKTAAQQPTNGAAKVEAANDGPATGSAAGDGGAVAKAAGDTKAAAKSQDSQPTHQDTRSTTHRRHHPSATKKTTSTSRRHHSTSSTTSKSDSKSDSTKSSKSDVIQPHKFKQVPTVQPHKWTH